jgi:hypothetical protein
MRSIQVLIVALISVLSFAIWAEDLQTGLTENRCDYYDYYESVKQCGPKGYPIGFGKKYCEKFSARRSKFSITGQLWIDNTMDCLIDQLDQTIGDPDLTCKKIKRISISQHARCYTDNGFCRLKMKDRLKALRVVLPELHTLNFYRGFFASAKLCKDKLASILKKKNSQIESLASQSEWQEIFNQIDQEINQDAEKD